VRYQVSHPDKKRSEIFAYVSVMFSEIGDRATEVCELMRFSEIVLFLTFP
jgi:hypothetical protein